LNGYGEIEAGSRQIGERIMADVVFLEGFGVLPETERVEPVWNVAATIP
jgi:hypothetical protein